MATQTGKGRRRPDPKAARKNDSGKLRWSLLPTWPMAKIVEVYTIGAKKYGAGNYLKEPVLDWDRVFDAMMRHAQDWKAGERDDPEDGQHHLASVCWCAMTLMLYEHLGIGANKLPETEAPA